MSAQVSDNRLKDNVTNNMIGGSTQVVPRHLTRILRWMAADVLIILVVYALVPFAVQGTFPLARPEFAALVFGALLAIVLGLYTNKVYHMVWPRTSGYGISRIILPILVVWLLMVLIDVPFSPMPVPLVTLLIANLFILFGILSLRYRTRLLTGASWRVQDIRHREYPITYTHIKVLVVGAGEAGQELVWRMKHRLVSHDYSYDVIGFVDDDPTVQGLYIELCPVLGTRADIPALAAKYDADLVVLAIFNIVEADRSDILRLCEKTSARIKTLPDVFALMNANKSATLLRDAQIEDLIGRGAQNRNEAIDLSLVLTKTVLVTGGAGSIGSELCRQLCAYGVERLLMLDNNESGLYDLEIELATKFPAMKGKITPILADVTVDRTLGVVFTKYCPQVVFHAAAYKHVPMIQEFPNEALRVNIGGSRRLAELSQSHGIERFVLISTDKAVDPSNVMGASKRVCELILRALSAVPDNHTVFTSVRFGNVLGSRGSVVPTFNRQIENGGPVKVTHRDMTRFFMSIPEAANLVIHAACLTNGTDIFLLKMGEAVRILDLAERMIRLRGLRPYIDIPIEFSEPRPGEKLHEKLHSDSEILRDTLHPGISQLSQPDKPFPAQAFFADVDALMTTDLVGHTEQISELIQRYS